MRGLGQMRPISFIIIPSARLERIPVHYGWIIVIACLIIGVAGYGTYFCFTLFYSHLVAEFGWSRSVVSGAMSLGLVTYGLFALPMGWCADRFGPRRTVLVGGGLFGLGTALGAFITEAWQLYALYGGLSAVGMGAVWAPLVATVSRWFDASRRGTAIGIAVLGSGSGIFFMAPLAEVLIAQLGWRDAYIWLGVIAGSVIILSALFLTRDPAERGVLPYGATPHSSQNTAPDTPLPSISRFARSPLFWRMCLSFGLWWFAAAIAYIQIAPYMLEKGFTSSVAAAIVTLYGGGNCIGRIVMGRLCDTLGPQQSYRLSLVISTLAMAAFAWHDGFTSIAITAAILGFGIGGASTQITTVSIDLFGTAAAGVLMGAVLAIVGLLGAGGPLVSGAIHDATLSYTPAVYMGAAVFLAATILSFGLQRK